MYKAPKEKIEFEACLKRAHQGDIALQYAVGNMYTNSQHDVDAY